jgi:hypothetical protein
MKPIRLSQLFFYASLERLHQFDQRQSLSHLQAQLPFQNFAPFAS